MKSYQEKEAACEAAFRSLGECWHIWTPADFEIIFRNDDDFRMGMSIVGVCTATVDTASLLTFELMSNHIHLCVAGSEESASLLFKRVKETFKRYFKSQGRTIDWSRFNSGFRKLSTLQELRTVILYDNRNGYVVHPEYSPFTYPWGANRYFFNPDARALANICSKPISLRERRRIIHSRIADSVEGLKSFEGYVLPLSFCNISIAESLFTDESNYFFRIGKCIEASKEIAAELKENVFYTDDELFSSICQISHVRYGTKKLSQLPADSKLELARIMRSDYNASAKQIIRFLKLPQSVLESIGIK